MSTHSSNRAAKLSERIRSATVGQGNLPMLMGILNVTPDSFSDGGQYKTLDQACAQVDLMLSEGADIIDIGGESTRPGATAVTAEAELQRVIPVIEKLLETRDICISVDTSKVQVMAAAIAAGAAMINDVMALADPAAMEVVADCNLPVCLMHMQGSPRTMQKSPRYDDVVEDVIQYLTERVSACVKAGVDEQRIVLDPGFGFGKTLQHNYQLLRGLPRFESLGLPLLVGMSRKSMIGDLLKVSKDERANASAILAALATERGAAVLRVHDLWQSAQARALAHATVTM